MRKVLLILFFGSTSLLSFGQSETIRKWHDKYEDAYTMFFYKSTLNMLNMTDSEEFKDLVKDIEKMKLLNIDKSKYDFTSEQYKELVSDYRGEDFEELMTLKQKEMKINAFIKEKDGDTKGLAVMLNSEDHVTILDIKGKIPLAKIGEFAQHAGEFMEGNLDNFDF